MGTKLAPKRSPAFSQSVRSIISPSKNVCNVKPCEKIKTNRACPYPKIASVSNDPLAIGAIRTFGRDGNPENSALRSAPAQLISLSLIRLDSCGDPISANRKLFTLFFVNTL
jgi:hypothetical protein